MIAGVVLCGGASRRMGQPKALLDFLGQPLICHMIRIVQTVCESVVVAAGPNQTLPEFSNDIIVSRDPAEFDGPVHGLRAALSLLPLEASHAFVTGCDMPLLQPELIRAMFERIRFEHAVVPIIDNVVQPLPAVFPVAATLRVTSASSLKNLLQQLPVIEFTESNLRKIDPNLSSFQPMNTPPEFAAALRRASS